MRRSNLAVLLMSWLFASVAGCAEEEYLQTECTVYENSVGVWLTKNGEKKDGVPYRVFEFSKKGVLIGVSPMHYGQEWPQVAEIKFQKASNPDVGLLSLKLHEKDGDQFTQAGGVITKECWASIGEFLEKNDVDVKLVTEQIDG